jgi:hypothetical protein
MNHWMQACEILYDEKHTAAHKIVLSYYKHGEEVELPNFLIKKTEANSLL